MPKLPVSSSHRPAGIREVAELAGAGIASVSRALSGQPGVSDAMTARVLEAARQLGYRPNVLAQGLRRRTTRSIGFVVSDITNPLIAAIVRGAESVFSAAGFSILLTNSGSDATLDAERIETLGQRQVDGFIVLPALENEPETLAALRQSQAPIVVIDRSLPDDLAVSYVLSDHYTGVRAATRHLLGLGHRRIGLVVGRDVRPTRERIRAATNACKPFRPEVDVLVDRGMLSKEHGDEALERFLASEEPPTAVILGGNQLLEGALDATRRHRLRIGRHLSLVCCDDLPLSRLHDPAIATVQRDTELIGRQAAELLLDRIEHGAAPKSVLLPTTFEARASCASPSR